MYIKKSRKVTVVDSPCSEETSLFFLSGYFVNPLLKTPADKFNVAKIVKTCYHDWYIVYTPYCWVVIIRVNIGVLIKAIPFWTTLQIVNQMDALTGADRFSYLFNKYLDLVFSFIFEPFHSLHSLSGSLHQILSFC